MATNEPPDPKDIPPSVQPIAKHSGAAPPAPEAIRSRTPSVQESYESTAIAPEAPTDLNATRSALGAAFGASRRRTLPDRFGDYELLELLGRGGMGVVYKARQQVGGGERLVALKVIEAGGLTAAAAAAAVERFLREARAAAALDHPGIVPIYDIGQIDGQHYFTMQLLAAGSLAERVREGPLPPSLVALLVRRVAEAVQHAHEHGVIHRDLKPANILLASSPSSAARGGPPSSPSPPLPSGERGEELPLLAQLAPKITDFGLARTRESGLSLSGEALGTPSYMPPEQARGQTAAMTAASDVYGLGAVLYCLLTGRPPFQASDAVETMRQVCDEEPLSPRQLNPQVPRNLETICLKCLEKEPRKRYATAADVADELGRFERGEPVRARPVGRLEKLGRWCSRHPAASVSVGMILATVVTAFALVMQSRNQEIEAKNQALQLAKDNADLATSNGQLAKENQDKATENARLAERERAARQKLQRQSAQSLLTEGRYSCERGDVGRGTLLLAHGLELAQQTKAADLEQNCRTELGLWRSRLPTLRELLPHADAVLAVAFRPDGQRILTGGAGQTVTLWDAMTGKRIGTPFRPKGSSAGLGRERFPSLLGMGSPGFGFPGGIGMPGSRPEGPPKYNSEVVAVAFSPDGRTLAAGTGDPFYRGRSQLLGAGDHLRGRPGTARGPDGIGSFPRPRTPGRSFPSRDNMTNVSAPLWDATSGQALHPQPFGGPVWAVAFSPDGRKLVTGGGTFQKERETDVLGRLGRMGRPGFGLDPFNRRERREPGGVAHLWDTVKGEHLRAFPHDNAVLAVAFSPDGRHVLTGSADRTARFWDVVTGRQVGKALAHDGLVLAVSYSPDGRLFVTCSQKSATQGTVQLWSTATGQPLGQPLPHSRVVLAAAFSPDSRTLVTGSGDPAAGKGEAQLWAVGTGKPLGKPLPHPGPVHAVAWSPDGRWVVTGCADKVARVWEAIPTPAVVQLAHHENVIAYSPDGQRVLLSTPSQDGLLCERFSLGDTASGKSLARLFLDAGKPRLVSFSPESRKLLLEFDGQMGDELRLVDAVSGKVLSQPLRPGGSIEAIAVSPDGHTILAGTSHPYQKKGEATLWDAAAGQLLRTFSFTVPILSVAFSPDGRTAATGSGMPGTAQGEVRLWDVATGRHLWTLTHQGPIRVVLFSPDGRTLASASDDHTARLWDVASGKPRGAALVHNAPVRALAFSADGGLLLTGSDDHTAQLWNTTTVKPIGAPLTHRGPVRTVAISGDGRLLATGSYDQTVQLWEAGTGQAVEQPLVHQGPIESVAFGNDGRTLLTRSTSMNTTNRRRVGDAWETSFGVSWRSTGRLWTVPTPADGDADTVLLRAQVTTGMELDAEGRVGALGALAWRERHGRLGKRGDAAPTAAALREWHRRAAREAEAAGEWFAVQWHLQRLGEGEAASEDLHARRGRAYALCNRWEPAIEDLTKALGPNDLRSLLWYFRGLAYYQLNQNDKALADFSEAIKKEAIRTRLNRPPTGDAWMMWFLRGQTFFRLRQFDKAREDLSQVLRMNPNHGPSLCGRGLCYAEGDEPQRAAADFAAALQKPGVPTRVWCDLAQVRLRLGDAKGYREACTQALQHLGETQDPALATTLVWTCSLAPGATADPDQIVRLATRAFGQRAESYVLARALGAALYRAGKYQDAIERFTVALQSRRQPAPSTWLFLALAHQRLKHTEEAKKWLDKARKWIEQARRQKAGEAGDEKALSWQKLPWNERLALEVLHREAEKLVLEK
jgi:WD40 repeat protein/serine/threonine protein kinase/tetratricopeptide (TPR) repeat protein